MKYSKIQLLLVLVLFAFSRSHQLRRRNQRTLTDLVQRVFDKRQLRIVGGVEAPSHSIPYQTVIYHSEFFCGGSLITIEFVLTSAYCAKFSNDPTIILGAHDLFAHEEDTQYFSAKRIIIHENYQIDDQADLLKNDIALICLDKQATLNEYVGTIPIAQSDAPTFEGSLLQASGWGKTTETKARASNVLHVIWVPGITNSECKLHYVDKLITDGVLCVDTSGGKSTCHGDSGGPLVDVDSGVLVGVASFVEVAGCETELPAGFTRVSHYTEWIENKVGGKRHIIK